MEINRITISKGQHLADVYPLIESNIILNKKLSGVGATHCEIIAQRHSIIVVPNVPIITCKVEKHRETDNLFGVMSNVELREIEEYLGSTLAKKKFVKIMVTPESFYKVRQAFDEIELSLYDDCFLMLDECHKFIKERDFRPEIVQPLHFFFKFKNKALVSATPIIPSDPRFIEQHFKLVEVTPDFYHLFEISIIETNDIKRAFYDDIGYYRKGHMPSEPHCIFVNSASIIADLINQSGIHDWSSIFCSEKSAVKLKQLGFKNVHTEWKNEYKNHFMFFTSRFFTGLDIWLDVKPRVIYLSDAEKAEQTLMDPNTDMAQACGRFRNGMKEIEHYVVFNPSIEKKSRQDIDNYINGIIKSCEALRNLYERCESKYEKSAIKEAMQSLPFKEIFFGDEIDYFFKDNIIDFEEVKQYYYSFSTLRDAYGSSGYFRVPWLMEPHIYTVDSVTFNPPKRQSSKELHYRQRKSIVETLEWAVPYRGTSAINEIIYTLKEFDSTIVDAYFQLGKDFIVQCDYNITLIKQELLNRKNSLVGPDEAFFNVLYSSFEVGKKYLRSVAKNELNRIYKKFGLTPPSTITAKSLAWHFDIDDKARIGNQKAVKILRRKANGVIKYFKEIKQDKDTVTITKDHFGD